MSRKNRPQSFGLNIVLLAVFGLLVLGSPARADLKVPDLTGTAVTGVGPYYQDVSDAIKQFAGRNFDATFTHLQAAKKATPQLAPPEVMMAQLYFDAGQTPAGIAMLEKAITGVPGDPEAFVILGERAVAEGRLTEARYMFAQAAKLVESFSENPRRKQNLQVRAYTGSASVDESRQNWEPAKAKLEALVKLDPRNATVHERLGRVLLALGKEQEAYAEFKLAAEADPKAMPAELAMAAQLSDPAKVQKWLDYALKSSPNDLRTQLGAANFLFRTNQIAAAKTAADAALKLDPEGLDTNLISGVLARMEGDFKKAVACFSKAHLLAPANPTITNHLALCLIELPDAPSQQRALQFAEINARHLPGNSDIMAAYGWICYKLNRRSDAERAFNAVLQSSDLAGGKMTSEIAFYMANLAKEAGKLPDAVNILREALNTEQPFAYRKQAEQMLEQLSKLAPTAAAGPRAGKAAP